MNIYFLYVKGLNKIRNKYLSLLYKLVYSKKVNFSNVQFGKGFTLEMAKTKCSLVIGRNVKFRQYSILRIRESGSVIIGDNVFFNSFLSVNCRNKVTIGENCLFGENVRLYDHNHRFRNKAIPVNMQGYSVGEIKIGNNCWIGSNVTILKNADIGDNAVIGANVVIASSVPANTIVKQTGGALQYEEY